MLEKFYDNTQELEENFDLKNVEKLKNIYQNQENEQVKVNDLMSGLNEEEIKQITNILYDEDRISLDGLTKEELEKARESLEEYDKPKGLR